MVIKAQLNNGLNQKERWRRTTTRLDRIAAANIPKAIVFKQGKGILGLKLL
jgi:hypothetical protein